jgi:hypothetical protein
MIPLPCEAILQSLLFNSSHRPKRSTELSWLFKTQLLQEYQNSLQTETFLDSSNQIWTDIAETLNLHYSQLLARGLMLRTQALTELAYCDTPKHSRWKIFISHSIKKEDGLYCHQSALRNSKSAM